MDRKGLDKEMGVNGMSETRKEPQKKKGLKSIIAIIVVVIIAFYFPEFFSDEEESPSREGFIPVELVKTIDGDTIKIIYEGKEQNLRYLLIDTPELNHAQQGEQPFAEEATKRNDELLNSGKLEIEFDIGEREDKYGRLLAYVYIDGESVQEKLVEEGLARVAYVFPPNTKHLDPYEKLEEHAKKSGIGIWSLEDYVTNRGFKDDVDKE